MIGVVADDFSGAAEMAGVGYRFGLRSAVISQPSDTPECDLLAFNTQSRSLASDQAQERVLEAATSFDGKGLEWAFKKTDSVLRGPVLAEIRAALKGFHRARCLVLPGQPALGRIVRSGRLWVQGKPLHESFFAEDPEYPARTSNVLDLLGVRAHDRVHVVQLGQPWPDDEVLVGECSSAEDAAAWAKLARRESMLPAGAAFFFASLLEDREVTRSFARESAPNLPGPTLWVHGSAGEPSRQALCEAEAHGLPVLRMPESVFSPGRDPERGIASWAREVNESLGHSPVAAVAVDRSPIMDPGRPEVLNQRMAWLVRRVLADCPVKHLMAEGGATAWALCRAFGWAQFRVRFEWAPGVVTLVPNQAGLAFTTKPGSYPWPEEIRRLLLRKDEG